MMQENPIQELRAALKAAWEDPANRKGRGLKTPAVRKVARESYRAVNSLPKGELFDLCQALLDSGDWAKEVVAFEWAFRSRRNYTTDDFPRFESWLDRYVDGWASCDDFCTHAFGHLVYQFPEHIPTVKSWTQSQDQWFRRGAAVVMIYANRRGQSFAESFEIADLLLMDGEDLVQKGYGWMLKEISKLDPQPVFDFVMARKERMPRTALRYAIEKLDPDLRKQAMQRG